MTDIEQALRWMADHSVRLAFTTDAFGPDFNAPDHTPYRAVRLTYHGRRGKLVAVAAMAMDVGLPVSQMIVRACNEMVARLDEPPDGPPTKEPPCHPT